ncbi:MAG: hypothetical protein BGO98_37300 [Myxococcales bacterium 68-20]|nr:GNAT family N-acetyltransferase [Myxococcales bacterium]OJY22249.1 MAG: hypothetical protein BGO98_37300 [Myxococcales bacterium 68-20]
MKPPHDALPVVRIAEARPEDLGALEAYLVTRTDTCMFLRSNLRQAGLAWSGQRYGAQYMLAWRGDAVVGVVAHAWSNMLLVQADEAIGELASAVVASSGRTVAGLSGPLEQVIAARKVLGLAEQTALLDSAEILMSLALDDLQVPRALAEGHVRGRRAMESDRDRLIAWRAAYVTELLGKQPGAELDAEAADNIDAALAADRIWVITDDDAIVAMSAFNAELPDCVQIGGVYTPPALRRRGYARAAVAASLLDARARGVRRAVLFTAGTDAEAAYRALGFVATGRFGLIFLR